MIVYRTAEAGDVSALHALLQALSDHEGGDDVASAAVLLAHGFGSRPLYQAILAEEGGIAVGMVIFYPDFSTHRGQPGLYVQDVYVRPHLRGQGIGSALMAAAMRLQDWGARYLTLCVGPENRLAKAYYAARGFRPRGYEFLILDGEALDALQKQ